MHVGSDEESGSDNIVVVTDMHPSRAALSTVTSPSESDEDGLVVSPGPSQRDSVSQVVKLSAYLSLVYIHFYGVSCLIPFLLSCGVLLCLTMLHC